MMSMEVMNMVELACTLYVLCHQKYEYHRSVHNMHDHDILYHAFYRVKVLLISKQMSRLQKHGNC